MTGDDDPQPLTRYERHLLGHARRALDDLVGATDPYARAAAVSRAADVAQRIVDEIGHPVTDESALGPYYRDVLADIAARAADTDHTAVQRLHAIRSICTQALHVAP